MKIHVGARYNLVSLFSGAGGLDLGFKQTGAFEVIFANDISLPACLTYSANFGLKLEIPKGPIVEAERKKVFACDVASVDFSPLRGEVDVVVGGPPCQDFSIIRGASKRKGIKVRRGRLYAYFVKALKNLQPKVFLFENVPGLKSANQGLAYKTILEDFSNLELRWSEVKEVINGNNNCTKAQEYELIFSDIVDMTCLGVPQMRERLIVIGVRKDLVRSLDLAEFWSLKSALNSLLEGRSSIFKKYPLTPIEAFEGKPLPELQSKYAEVMKEYENIWNEVGTKYSYEWKKRVWDKLTFDVIEDYINFNGILVRSRDELDTAFEEHSRLLKELRYYDMPVSKLDSPDGSNKLPSESAEVIERMKRIPPGENHEFVWGTRWQVKGLMSNIYRRAFPLTPAPTVIAYGGGGTWGYHYERSRSMLTNRERARLQTFPDSFLFKGSWAQVRAQIGEAVPPLATKRIAEALLPLLNEI